MSPLEQALADREREYTAALDDLRDRDVVTDDQVHLFREAICLVRCLRRMARDKGRAELHAVFGAPGDFGYGTPIGDALARTYRGEP